MKKNYIIVIYVIVSVFLFTSCERDLDKGKSSGKNGHFWRASWGGALQGLPIDRYNQEGIQGKITINNPDMLYELFSDTYSLSLNELETDWVRDERFSTFIAKYDDTFFETKQLVTFFLTASEGGIRFNLSGTTYTDGMLNMDIDCLSVGIGITSPVKWFAIIETLKVPEDTTININVTDWLGRKYTF